MLKVVALAGGVGGAKLVDGLARCLPAQCLTVVVNTGDDFEHFGLRICPDLDTVCYTLAGLANPATGWGRAGESWRVLEGVISLGGPGWFQLGDLDLATHLERTRRLRLGQPLGQITRDFCQSWGIELTVLPATDDFVPTWVYTELGEMPFQEYFVHHQCQPRVTGFRFHGVERASPAPGVLAAIRQADLVVICPSNPWVSIAPILAIPGIRAAIQERATVGVSPIVAGRAIKGPAAKMYAELGIEPSAFAVAAHYGNLLRGFVLDQLDRSQAQSVEGLHLEILVTNTLMHSPEDRQRLAGEILEFGASLLKPER